MIAGDWTSLADAVARVLPLVADENEARAKILQKLRWGELPARATEARYYANRVIDPRDGFTLNLQTRFAVREAIPPEYCTSLVIDWETGNGLLFSSPNERICEFRDIHVETSQLARLFPATQPTRSTGGPGRPEKLDWKGALIEAAAFIHENGLPPTQAELVEHIVEWLEKNGPEVKSDSDVRKVVSRLYERFNQGVKK